MLNRAEQATVIENDVGLAVAIQIADDDLADEGDEIEWQAPEHSPIGLVDSKEVTAWLRLKADHFDVWRVIKITHCNFQDVRRRALPARRAVEIKHHATRDDFWRAVTVQIHHHGSR